MFCSSCLGIHGPKSESCWQVITEFVKVIDSGPKPLSRRALSKAATSRALEPCACCWTEHDARAMRLVEVDPF